MSIWSVTAVVDRYALHNRIQSKIFYAVLPALLQLPLVLILSPLFAPSFFDARVIAVGILGGFIELAFLYYFYVAMSSEEVGRVFPLMSIGPVFTLIGGWVLLGDALASNELIALTLLIIGGIIVAFKRQENTRVYRLSKGVMPLLFGTLLISAYTLSLRYVFLNSDFATGFFYSRVGFFIGGLVVLFIFREEIVAQWNTLRNKPKVIIIGNQVAAFGGHAFYFSALALANAALVQSVLSIQSISVFALAALVTALNPKLVSESITKHDVLQKVAGIICIIIGLNFVI